MPPPCPSGDVDRLKSVVTLKHVQHVIDTAFHKLKWSSAPPHQSWTELDSRKNLQDTLISSFWLSIPDLVVDFLQQSIDHVGQRLGLTAAMLVQGQTALIICGSRILRPMSMNRFIKLADVSARTCFYDSKRMDNEIHCIRGLLCPWCCVFCFWLWDVCWESERGFQRRRRNPRRAKWCLHMKHKREWYERWEWTLTYIELYWAHWVGFGRSNWTFYDFFFNWSFLLLKNHGQVLELFLSVENALPLLVTLKFRNRDVSILGFWNPNIFWK